MLTDISTKTLMGWFILLLQSIVRNPVLLIHRIILGGFIKAVLHKDDTCEYFKSKVGMVSQLKLADASINKSSSIFRL